MPYGVFQTVRAYLTASVCTESLSCSFLQLLPFASDLEARCLWNVNKFLNHCLIQKTNVCIIKRSLAADSDFKILPSTCSKESLNFYQRLKSGVWFPFCFNIWISIKLSKMIELFTKLSSKIWNIFNCKRSKAITTGNMYFVDHQNVQVQYIIKLFDRCISKSRHIFGMAGWPQKVYRF